MSVGLQTDKAKLNPMPQTALAILKDLIRFPSLSHQEKEISDYVVALARAGRVDTWRKGDNVVLSLGNGPNCLLLNSHLDVVPPSNGHPFDPFEPTEVDGRLFGRGSVDAKASGAAMLKAMLNMAESGSLPSEGRLLLALTSCEENGQGYNGLEDVLPDLPTIHAAVVGEPTDLQVCSSQKGLLILRLTATGPSVHPARAAGVETAIQIAARDVSHLTAYTFERDHPQLGRPTASVTSLVGGSPEVRNVVPDTCTVMVDIRSTPAYTHDELVDIFRRELKSSVDIHSKRLVPCDTDVDSPIVRTALEAAKQDNAIGSPTMSDWIFLGNIPTVKMGPGSSDLSHTASESIPVDEVDHAVEVYSRLIRRYFENNRMPS
jgi:acetylornithine deacetylase